MQLCRRGGLVLGTCCCAETPPSCRGQDLPALAASWVWRSLPAHTQLLKAAPPTHAGVGRAVIVAQQLHEAQQLSKSGMHVVPGQNTHESCHQAAAGMWDPAGRGLWMRNARQQLVAALYFWAGSAAPGMSAQTAAF